MKGIGSENLSRDLGVQFSRTPVKFDSNLNSDVLFVFSELIAVQVRSVRFPLNLEIHNDA